MKKVLIYVAALGIVMGLAIYLFVDSFHLDESKRTRFTYIQIKANDPDNSAVACFVDGVHYEN